MRWKNWRWRRAFVCSIYDDECCWCWLIKINKICSSLSTFKSHVFILYDNWMLVILNCPITRLNLSVDDDEKRIVIRHKAEMHPHDELCSTYFVPFYSLSSIHSVPASVEETITRRLGSWICRKYLFIVLMDAAAVVMIIRKLQIMREVSLSRIHWMKIMKSCSFLPQSRVEV